MKIILLLLTFILTGCEYHLEVYGPKEIREETDQAYCRQLFGSEELEDQGETVVISAWREMDAHYKGHSLIFEPKPNGRVYNQMKLLVFDRPSDTHLENINFPITRKSLEWLEKYDKKNIDNKVILDLIQKEK